MPIVWDQISTEPFISLEGDLDPDGLMVEEITRPGVAGVAFRELAKRGSPSRLVGTVAVASSTVADLLMTTYKSFQGTLVSITLREVVRTNYIVLDVRILDRFEVATPVGGPVSGLGPTAWMVVSEWTVQYAGIPI